MNEIWKPIPNFEELYEISNLGKVKSLNYRRTKKEHNKLNIIGMYKNGILLEKFYGTGEIKRKYNYCPISILDCCKGKYKKAYGYEWKFILELLEEVE